MAFSVGDLVYVFCEDSTTVETMRGVVVTVDASFVEIDPISATNFCLVSSGETVVIPWHKIHGIRITTDAE